MEWTELDVSTLLMKLLCEKQPFRHVEDATDHANQDFRAAKCLMLKVKELGVSTP